MKIYSKKLVVMVAACMVVANGVSYAKVRVIQSRRDFEKNVAKESMIVAFFYDEKNKDLTRMYEDVSKIQMYDDADVIFLKVNAARQELHDLVSLYGITTTPVFIFFSKGKRLTDAKGMPVALSGSVSRDALQSFIDMHYGAEIKNYVTQKEARNKQRLDQEGESWKVYFYPRDMFVPGYGPEERTLE